MTGATDDTVADFVAAWDIAHSEYLPAFVVALTGAGERLAAAVGRPVAPTRALAGSLADLIRLEDDTVHMTLGTSSPSPRGFWSGSTTAPSGPEAAPRICSGSPSAPERLYVSKPRAGATGTAIRVELEADRVAAVVPGTTVVAVVHPGRQRELMDTLDATIEPTAGPDEDFCYHRPFFATPEAATDWLATHPGGRLFTVAEFLEFWRRVTRETLARAGWKSHDHHRPGRGAVVQNAQEFGFALTEIETRLDLAAGSPASGEATLDSTADRGEARP